MPLMGWFGALGGGCLAGRRGGQVPAKWFDLHRFQGLWWRPV